MGDRLNLRGGQTVKIPFTKLHGNGNDFILIDEYDELVIPDPMKGEFAGSFCDRHFGIGADGVLYLSKAQSTGDLLMRLFRPDQSEAEMCGNGIRCFVKYAFDHHHVGEKCVIETKAGLIPVAIRYIDDDFMADVLMQDPKFDRPDIPATGNGEYQEKIAGYDVYAVNSGAPHAVIFVEHVESLAIETIASQIRNHPTFPEGTNVNFVEKNGENSIIIRTYDRDAEGESLSCGTGAIASASVAHKIGIVGETVHVDTEGGPLNIRLGNETHLEGPASTVFVGEITF